MKVEAFLYLNKIEIDVTDRGLANAAKVHVTGTTLASDCKIKGTFDVHFDLSREEAEFIKEMFKRHSIMEIEGKNE